MSVPRIKKRGQQDWCMDGMIKPALKWDKIDLNSSENHFDEIYFIHSFYYIDYTDCEFFNNHVEAQ